jgi:glyoxylase-like metal-dependent hydrolase (beta-lactamase superfamily II)
MRDHAKRAACLDRVIRGELLSGSKLGDGVWAAIVDDSGKAGGNAGFVVGDDGIAVIDTFENAVAARELLTAIRQIGSLPIRFVVNTHYHLDHVAGNEVFASAGAVVVSP